MKLPDLTSQESQRTFVIVGLVAMFAFALVHEMVWNTDAQTKNLLIGALIGSFSTGAVQYLFGTSPQSADKDKTISKMAENTETALQSTPPPGKPAPPAQPAALPVAVVAFLALILSAGVLLGAGGHAWAGEKAAVVDAKTSNCIPYPQCLGGGPPDNPVPSPGGGGADPFSDSIVSDLAAAITVANAPPVLPNEVACFTKLHDDLSAMAKLPSGAGLFTAYVVLVRKEAALADLQSDPCLAVCGRASQIVSVPVLARILPTNLVPNICQLAKLVTP